jgi:hypothetical protein
VLCYHSVISSLGLLQVAGRYPCPKQRQGQQRSRPLLSVQLLAKMTWKRDWRMRLSCTTFLSCYVTIRPQCLSDVADVIDLLRGRCQTYDIHWLAKTHDRCGICRIAMAVMKFVALSQSLGVFSSVIEVTYHQRHSQLDYIIDYYRSDYG